MSHEELLKQIHQVMKDNGVDSATVIADEDVLRGINEDNIAKVLLPDSFCPEPQTSKSFMTTKNRERCGLSSATFQ